MKSIHLVLPAKVSINWISPLINNFGDGNDISWEITDEDQSFSAIKNRWVRWVLKLEKIYYRLSWVSFKGYEVNTLLGPSDSKTGQVYNFTNVYVENAIRLNYSNWTDTILGVCRPVWTGKGHFFVNWYKEGICSSSVIQTKTYWADQVRAYFGKLSLDAVKGASNPTDETNNEVQATFGVSQFIQTLRKKIGNRYKQSRWALKIEHSGESSLFSAPDNGTWADPFVVSHEGQTYILYESMEPGSKGEIHIATLQKGEMGAGKVLLTDSFHFSYPFVVEDKDKLFLVPEIAESKKVDIYELDLESQTAGIVSTLLNGESWYDPTLINRDGTWYLFATKMYTGLNSFNDDLYLYYADNLLDDDWSEHPLNPIVTDVRKARPAGALFEKEGRLIRPSQNCSGYYGKSVILNEILELSKTNYLEQEVGEIDPEPGFDGVHTYNSVGNTSVSDQLLRI